MTGIKPTLFTHAIYSSVGGGGGHSLWKACPVSYNCVLFVAFIWSHCNIYVAKPTGQQSTSTWNHTRLAALREIIYPLYIKWRI